MREGNQGRTEVLSGYVEIDALAEIDRAARRSDEESESQDPMAHVKSPDGVSTPFND